VETTGLNWKERKGEVSKDRLRLPNTQRGGSLSGGPKRVFMGTARKRGGGYQWADNAKENSKDQRGTVAGSGIGEGG